MQFSVTADLDFGSRHESAQCFDAPQSSYEPPSLGTHKESHDEFVPFLREVEGMVDKAFKAVETQIIDCVQALVSEMPATDSRPSRSRKLSSTWHRGN